VPVIDIIGVLLVVVGLLLVLTDLPRLRRRRQTLASGRSSRRSSRDDLAPRLA
jgi:hypothetical protein